MKPTHTALYELMRRKRAEREQRAERPPEPAPEEDPPSGGWRSSAGRTIRLPVGYLWLAGAVGLVLLVAAFSTGYMRGQQDTTRKLEGEWLATRQPTLAVPPPEITPRKPARTPKPAAGPGKATTARGPAKPATASSGPGAILSDPRQAGINYFILIHTHRDNAVELAEFCRAEGVVAYAIPDGNNRSLYRVIVVPGYARGQRSSAPVRALEQRIADVTRKWKLEVNPRDELGYYPERYGG